MATAVAPSQPKALRPFRMGTRQRFAKVNGMTWVTGGALAPQEFPRVGMLSRAIVQATLTVTFSAGGTMADQGPWNVINRHAINTNIGAASVVSVSGFGAYVAQRWLQRGYLPDVGLSGANTTPYADIHAASTSSGAQSWQITTVLQVSANCGPQFEMGLINLQAPETRVTYEPVGGNLTDAATLITSITGTVNLYYEYYELPDPAQFNFPPLALVRLLEDQQAVAAVGDNVYTVPRQGTALGFAAVGTFNGARSDGIDSLSLRFNKTDSPYVIQRQAERAIERIRYGLNPTAGVFYLDLWHAVDEVSQGDTRDAIDTEELSTLELVMTVSSGTTLGSNNNFYKVVRRIVQLLEG